MYLSLFGISSSLKKNEVFVTGKGIRNCKSCSNNPVINIFLSGLKIINVILCVCRYHIPKNVKDVMFVFLKVTWGGENNGKKVTKKRKKKKEIEKENLKKKIEKKIEKEKRKNGKKNFIKENNNKRKIIIRL
ncbi:hypothetical protein RFI_21896 [Reticulomyxa filosa]|uniref:Uncharacterized protein n=1 Tax=Reticulomyxa filosa TaxID=46433 RepID=X6MNA3_RETFI|nr:hypothetical protein RFI_21896 [Reticulomyxa filosa]|eukprot:ETO15468.1 hypothetical protein RFI_21896 [Reticulomyxa filosa]